MPGFDLIHDPLDTQAEGRPDQLAYSFEDVEYTYAGFAERTRQVAAGLAELGLDRGSVIAAHARNHVDLYTIFYACSRIGAVFTPLSTHRSADELQSMIDVLAPDLLVYTRDGAVVDGNLATLRASLTAAPFISLDQPGLEDDPTLDDVAISDGTVSADGIEPADRHNVFWTSGTTGRPKGVVRNHADSLGFLEPAIGTFPFRAGSVRLLPRHMMYVAAYLQYGLPAVMHGETTVILRSFSVDDVIEVARAHDIYVSSLGFTPAKRVLDHLERVDDRIEIDTSHTVLPSRAFALRLLERVHDEIWHVYSTTEVGGPFVEHFDPETDESDPPLVGQPGEGVEVRLVHPEPAAPIDPTDTVDDGPGELLVRGQTTMTRYLREEVQRDRVRDGWVATGDLFRRTASGAYQYLGRVDNRIRSGGVNVHPEPLERALAEHPDIAEAVVVGVPDEEWGERVAALVVAPDVDGDRSALAADLDAFARSSDAISSQLRPRSYRVVESIEAIPSGGRGKYDRDGIATLFD